MGMRDNLNSLGYGVIQTATCEIIRLISAFQNFRRPIATLALRCCNHPGRLPAFQSIRIKERESRNREKPPDMKASVASR